MKFTEEKGLRVAATLISKNPLIQEDWVNTHRNQGLVSSYIPTKVAYIAVMCFAPVYLSPEGIIRLSLKRECISQILFLENLNNVFKRLFVFIDRPFVLFKVDGENFKEVTYTLGFDFEGITHRFKGLVLPLPFGAKPWVEVEGEKREIQVPEIAFQNYNLALNRDCWCDCKTFEGVISFDPSVSKDDLCDECSLKKLIKGEKV